MASNRRGKAKMPEYGVWADMLQRCKNPNLKNYNMYGGRGIKVCERWKEFDNFLADMGRRPLDTSLGRINNDGNYEPMNCRWETVRQQSLNKRQSRYIKWRGQIRTVTEWAEETGISRATIATRLNRGWPTESALTIKPFSHGARRWPLHRYV